MKTNQEIVQNWMREQVGAYLNKTMLIVDEAQLAEDAYEHFHPDWSGWTGIPEVWYEYALMVAEEWQINHGYHNYTDLEARNELKSIREHIYPEHED